ncbi:MAG: hypothetical protein ABSD48_01940 [Armatimonadota bacterium]
MRTAGTAALLLVWLASLSLCSCAAPAPKNAKLIIAILDQITWPDLLGSEVHAPTLRRLARDGGIGMMSVRAARVAGGEGGYLTLGAGSRATAVPHAGQISPEAAAFDAGEIVDGLPARQVYASRTGWPVGDSAIAGISIGELIRQNSSLSYPITLGLLGGALRRAGLRVACVGNADTQREAHRELAAIGMDEQGLVELGDVGADLLKRQPNLPYRMTTDPARLLAAFHRAAEAADMIVVDLGETSRVGEYMAYMPPSAAKRERTRAIEQADRLLGAILTGLSPKSWGVLVLTPTVRDADPDEQFAALTPVIFRQPGGAKGLLTSPSTRRGGIVASTDVAATVLEYFNVGAPEGMVGRPMRVEPARDALLGVRTDYARQTDVEILRRYVFRWVAVLAIIALWAAAAMFALGDTVPRWLRSLNRGLLLVLLSAPPALLLVALRPLPLLQMAGAAAAMAVLIALVGAALTSWRSGHALPAIALMSLLVYDLLRGEHMLQWSPLSYSAASGARFYGMGDEYGGALLGAAIVAIAALLSQRRHPSSGGERVLAGAVLLGVAGMAGYARFGANLGMGLECAVGFAVFIAYLWRERPRWGHVALVLALMTAAAGAAIGADALHRGGEASHVGMFFSSVQSQGPSALVTVAARKWTMNWMLVRSSLWTDVALAAMGVLGVFLLARPQRAVAALAHREWLAPALVASVVGAAAAWAFNDSGIVAAALALIYGVGSFAYLGLGDAPE